MSDIICITNRKLCRGSFEEQVERIASSDAPPRAVILREKDLDEEKYTLLASDILKICKRWAVPLILHSFPFAARTLDVRMLHLPLPALRKMSADEKKYFSILGTSCHSVNEAIEAESLGASYITAGHIYETECKKGLCGRGLEFLRSVSKNVNIPVYAIGGITPDRAEEVRHAGAAGIAVMSALMECDAPEEYLLKFERQQFNDRTQKNASLCCD